MAFTLDQLNALDASIAQGALTVKYADKEVTYRSLTDMLKLRTLMATELNLIKPTRGRKYATFSKGIRGPRIALDDNFSQDDDDELNT